MNSARGFTMIEMLLATLMVGVLTTLAVLTFRAVTNGWMVSQDYMDKMQRTDFALNQVISGLRSMYYPHDGKQDDRGQKSVQLSDARDQERSRKQLRAVRRLALVRLRVVHKFHIQPDRDAQALVEVECFIPLLRDISGRGKQ